MSSTDMFCKVDQKTRPQRLTAYIVKTTKLIYVIFGTFQHSIVLNTPVKSILNKFISQVVPLSDKSTTEVFTCKVQARPLRLNAHIFKIPTARCTLFVAQLNAMIL